MLVTLFQGRSIKGMNSDNSFSEPDYLSGDPVAFGALVKRYQGSLFAYLGRMGLSDAICEELAQETFLRVWKNRDRYDPAKAALSTWIFTIGRNLALTSLTRKAVSVNEEADIDQYADLDSGFSQYTDPSKQYEHHESIVHLRQALNSLSVEDREVIAACYTPEIECKSEILNCSEGALRTRLSRARKRLSVALNTLDTNYE